LIFISSIPFFVISFYTVRHHMKKKIVQKGKRSESADI
jgi:hypothetical protein